MRDLWDWLHSMLDIELWMMEVFGRSILREDREQVILDDLRVNGDVPEMELHQVLQVQGVGMNPIRLHRLLRSMVAAGLVEFDTKQVAVDGFEAMADVVVVRLANKQRAPRICNNDSMPLIF